MHIMTANNGHFLTVSQSMFTEVEVANQWHCIEHTIAFVLIVKEHLRFVCEQTCEQLTQELIENGK